MKSISPSWFFPYLKELAKQLEGSKGKLYAVKADVKIEKEILDAFAWIEKNTPGVDILINNAGVAHTDNLIGKV